jgi:hypothetical protein
MPGHKTTGRTILTGGQVTVRRMTRAGKDRISAEATAAISIDGGRIRDATAGMMVPIKGPGSTATIVPKGDRHRLRVEEMTHSGCSGT